VGTWGAVSGRAAYDSHTLVSSCLLLLPSSPEASSSTNGLARMADALTAHCVGWRAAEAPPPPLIPTPQRQLYPSVASTDSGTLQVTPLHSVYYRVYGNPEGPAALVVHGGPGAGCFDKHACVWPRPCRCR
jgi:hypothetical protein